MPLQTIVDPTVEQLEQEGLYYAVITRIGQYPLLKIDRLGEFRFAYRNLKKLPGENKPVVAVGDKVTCRLTSTAPTKAVSVRAVPKEGLTLTVSILSDTSDTNSSEGSDLCCVAYSHDPYSPSGRSYLYAPSTPSASVGCTASSCESLASTPTPTPNSQYASAQLRRELLSGAARGN